MHLVLSSHSYPQPLAARHSACLSPSTPLSHSEAHLRLLLPLALTALLPLLLSLALALDSFSCSDSISHSGGSAVNRRAGSLWGPVRPLYRGDQASPPPSSLLPPPSSGSHIALVPSLSPPLPPLLPRSLPSTYLPSASASPSPLVHPSTNKQPSAGEAGPASPCFALLRPASPCFALLHLHLLRCPTSPARGERS